MAETAARRRVHGVSPIGSGPVSWVVAAMVCGALALAIPVTALSQSTAVTRPSDSASGELAEIVVSAEKRSSTVQTTPLSITALKGEDLAARGLSSAQEIVQAVPGIAIASAGPGQAKYEIRGLSSDGGESPTIGFYLNETPITPPASATTGKSAIDPDLYDLNRVEVLRGPQGTLYGSASMGGTVKLVTNRPDLASTYGSTETSVSGTDGGGLNYAQKGMINIPLVDNEVALRIVGNYGHDSGWIDRIVIPNFPIETNGGLTRGNVLGLPASAIHRGVNDADVRGVRASLLIQPNGALSITPMIFYQNISQGGLNTYDSVPGTLAHYQPFDVAEPFSDRFTVYSLTVNYAFERPTRLGSSASCPHATPPGHTPSGHKKILVVEDDTKIAMGLGIRLKAAGYDPLLAQDGLGAVNVAVKNRPDLVLLDISIPAGNGFTVARRIQTAIATPTPIIFLTASKRPEFRQQAEELGAVGFFEKPFEADQVLATIKQTLAGRPAPLPRTPSSAEAR